MTLFLDGEESVGDIDIPAGQLLYSRSHEVSVNYSFEE
jgi:hypothetical protein